MGADLHVRSVARAVSIMEQFTMERPEPNLTEISAGIGLSKSTAHRLLSTLEDAGMVDFNRKSGRYRLGLKAFRFGSVASNSMDLVKQAEPLLRGIAEETDQTALLLVVDGGEALCLRRFEGHQQVRVLVLDAGRRAPFNCGAAQRVLLAYLPEEQWEDVIAHHTVRMTQYSLTTREELERDRRDIRERGCSMGWEDSTLHACTLGAPVRGADGAVVAAVSILGIVQQFPAERLPALIRRVMHLGDDLSSRIGYVSY
jgi:DNA-binding IclR family transcriptional regulator